MPSDGAKLRPGWVGRGDQIEAILGGRRQQVWEMGLSGPQGRAGAGLEGRGREGGRGSARGTGAWRGLRDELLEAGRQGDGLGAKGCHPDLSSRPPPSGEFHVQ